MSPRTLSHVSATDVGDVTKSPSDRRPDGQVTISGLVIKEALGAYGDGLNLWLTEEEVGSCNMVLENVLSSPHRRLPRKPFTPNELGSWSTLVQRHRFLLTALALLTFLCTIYLYFAVTLGSSSSCFGLTGAQKTRCQLELAKTSMMAKGKLKIL